MSTAPPRGGRARWCGIAAAGAMGAIVVFAYAPSGDCGFLFDDVPSVAENSALQAGRWWQVAFGQQHVPIANRPVVCAAFALDHALFGLDPLAFRWVNVAVHLLNSLLLFAVVRGALRAPNLVDRFAVAGANRFAGAVALLWSVHPLGVDAVAYVTQRTTLLMATFFLAALWGLLRSAASRRRSAWEALVVLCTAAGMATKEELVAAPVLLLLFGRAFLWPDWRSAWQRWPLLVGLASTWLVLLGCVVAGPTNLTVGYATRPRATAFDWLCTQAVVVANYLRLCVWPSPLRGYYDWPIVRELGPAVLPGLLVVAALALTVLAWRRWPWWGWLGALCFLLLAPTSSIMPIVTEVVAERRMYLPMLAVLVPAVHAGGVLLRQLPPSSRPLVGAIALLAIAAAAVVATQQRVTVYANETSFWTDAYQRNELTNRGFQASMVLGNYAMVLRQQGDRDRAYELFDRAFACEYHTDLDNLHYAMSLVERNRRAEGVKLLRDVVRNVPDLAEARGNLASVLLEDVLNDSRGHPAPTDPRLAEAEVHARAAVRASPRRAAFANTLAWLLANSGRGAEAEPLYRRAIELEPRRPETYVNLADLLLAQGRTADAAALWQQLLATYPRDAELRLGIAELLLQRGDVRAAVPLLREVLRIDPSVQRAQQLLSEIERRVGK